MPKTKAAPVPVDDVPIWDALIADTDGGDPRPYEPSVIGTIVITDEPCVDDGGFDDLSTDLDDEVERFWHFADEVTHECRLALVAIITEFEEKYGPLLVPSPFVEQPTASALAQLDVEATLVLPVWPLEERTP